MRAHAFIVLGLEGDACRAIVGIMEDTRYATIEEDPTPMFFLPMAQAPGWGTRLFVRLNGDPGAGIASVRRALSHVEPGLPHVRAHLLRSHVDPQLQPWRLGSAMFTAFGVLALVMSGLGLYGVVAYDVARRRRELGVRATLMPMARANSDVDAPRRARTRLGCEMTDPAIPVPRLPIHASRGTAAWSPWPRDVALCVRCEAWKRR